VEINGMAVLAAEVKDMDGNAMRILGDQLKDKLGSGIVVLAGAKDGKVSLLAMATEDLVKKGVHAGNIIKAAAAVCGGGGGRIWRRRAARTPLKLAMRWKKQKRS
jgi:alanyl-tRNA synthetase